jgi:ribonuclease P protein component
MSLPKQYRVPQSDTYEAALKNGKMLRCGPFKIFTGSFSESRLGVVVPKKQMKLSHDRHRLRRRIHETMVPFALENTMVVVMLTQKIDPEHNLNDLESALKTLHHHHRNAVKNPMELLEDALRTQTNVHNAALNATSYIQQHTEYCDVHHPMHDRYRTLMDQVSKIANVPHTSIKTTPEA